MRAGQYITSSIRLVRPIGQGAMGSVWLADHLALNTKVAVKFMASMISDNPELVTRFRKEAQAAAQIRSPHVASVLDYGVTQDGAPYIVMELLEGETLQKRMQRQGGPLSLAEVVRVVSHTANALSVAHRLGVVHRDIKPDNLFVIEVGGEPFIKVLDFGIAKLTRPDEPGTTATNSLMGTPLYMSPEQLLSAKRVDHRTDLWSLAVVAYQAMTGRLPFTGDALGALAVSVNAGEFAAPSSVRPDLPAAVDAWMTRALQRDPSARFGTARELAEALQQAASGPAQRPGPVPSRPGARRESGMMAAVELPRREDRPRPPAPTVPTREERSSPRPTPRPGSEEARDTPVLELKVGARFIRVMRGKIEKSGMEAIVNAANSPSELVERAQRLSGGLDLPEITRLTGIHPVGSAMLTGVGQVPPPARALIHALLPTYGKRSDADSAALLRDAHLASLRLAEEQGIRSVAFPGISTGTHGYPTFKAAPIVIEAAIQHLKGARSVEQVLFVLLTEASHELFNAALSARAKS